MTLLQRATEFATRAHAGQKRKYTGCDYVTHPIQVSRLVATVPHTEAMLIAAVLHDTMEDCGVLTEGDRTLWLLADEACRRFENA